MKTIEKVIAFAIQNGYDYIAPGISIKEQNHKFGKSIKYIGEFVCYIGLIQGTKIRIPVNDIITSKEFIEALARGLIEIGDYHIDALEGWSNEITQEQAFAIRENTLEQFYQELIPSLFDKETLGKTL